jgi:hypothetical protein
MAVKCQIFVSREVVTSGKKSSLVKTCNCNIIFIKINSIIMQKLISLSCCAPKALHLQINFTHEELTCISECCHMLWHGIIRSRHFKIISSYPGVNTWNNNKTRIKSIA